MNRWKPSLEGSLSIFNLLSLVAMAFLVSSIGMVGWTWPLRAAVAAWVGILLFPIGTFCCVFLAGTRVHDGVVIAVPCSAAGLNAIVWGRGVGWVLRQTLLARYAQTIDDDDHSGAASAEDPPFG